MGKIFYLVILDFFAWQTARISQYKWNQPWQTHGLYPVLDREQYANSAKKEFVSSLIY